jgi:hypothetical protein
VSSSQDERVSPAGHTWELLESYREPEDQAWCWGFCEAAMRARLLGLAVRATSCEAEPAEIDSGASPWTTRSRMPADP